MGLFFSLKIQNKCSLLSIMKFQEYEQYFILLINSYIHNRSIKTSIGMLQPKLRAVVPSRKGDTQDGGAHWGQVPVRLISHILKNIFTCFLQIP